MFLTATDTLRSPMFSLLCDMEKFALCRDALVRIKNQRLQELSGKICLLQVRRAPCCTGQRIIYF